MNCIEQLSYVIRQGDNLYQLARYYQTTVPMILSLNPDIDPYNLRIGDAILICPGENFRMQAFDSAPPACPDHSRQAALSNSMRLAWSQHVYWTRMLLLSIAERLKDQNDVTARLLQNPTDIADIYADYYTPEVARLIAGLLTEHLQIGAKLITALRDGKTADAENLNRQWYINADKMADAFAGINPYYGREEVRQMFYTHLGLTKQEVAARLGGNYPADIKAFDNVEQEALSMADYFSSGIMQQFPQNFS